MNELQTPKIELIHLDKTIPLPEFATEGAAGMDLRITEDICLQTGDQVCVGTGVAVHIKDPEIVGVVVPRSSMGVDWGIQLANTVGVIDADYQGEIILNLARKDFDDPGTYVTLRRGTRIAQILFMPIIRPVFDVVDTFSEITKRGGGCFGSTGEL